MSQFSSWQDYFKEQLHGLEESFQKLGSSMSLLAFAFKEKRITTEEYLQWARKTYGLPLLHTSFYTETPLSQEMFAKWATHYRWSAECLPVAEWDGSLVVACLQPPQDFPQTPLFSLVLSNPEDLEKAWGNFTAPKVEAMSSLPEGMGHPPIPSAGGAQGFSAEDLFGLAATEGDSSSEEHSDEDLNASVDEHLEMLNLEPVSDVPSLVRISKPEAKPDVIDDEVTISLPDAVTPPAVPLATNPVTPATVAAAPVVAKQNPNLNKIPLASELAPVEDDMEKTRVTPTAHLKTPTPMAPVVTPAPEAAIAKPVVTPVAKEKLEKPIIIPVVPASPLPIPNTAEGNENRNIPGGTLAGMNGKPKSAPLPNAAFPLEKMKKRNANLIAEKVKKALTDMRTHFQKAMILTVDENETQVMAFAWDESFQGIPDTSVRIPLKTPSIFNIVTSTQKPFHGYVSLNPLNEKFFEDWNHGTIPDHVTITPIMSHDKVIAMIVGFSDKSAYNKMSLHWAEKLSSEFIKDLAA